MTELQSRFIPSSGFRVGASAAHLAQDLIADGALACNRVGVVVGRNEHHAVGNGSLDSVCLSVEYRTEKGECGLGGGVRGASVRLSAERTGQRRWGMRSTHA